MNTIQKIWKGSPNFWAGRKDYKPEIVVIHIMDGTLSGTDSWFANPASQVSAHFGIGRNGEIHQYVKEEDTAWHAGRVDSPSAKFVKPNINPNLYTIGIEHEGGSKDIWTDAMKKASSLLIREICQRWQIPIDRDHIIGHYQIYSKKPDCPSHDKKILDELVALANQQQENPSQVEEGIKKIEEGLDLIKQTLK
jgi:N-acetyl-anhydromuramyl-L-alanine amidase AmpD